MKYGVCRCDIDRYEEKAEILKLFDSYEEAYQYYQSVAFKDAPFEPPKDLWMAFVEEDKKRIVQFDRLKMESKVRIRSFRMSKNDK